MKFYENRNNNKKSEFYKIKPKIKKVIFPTSLTNEFRTFDVGDVVGLRFSYRDEEYIIESFKYTKNGRLIYTLKSDWQGYKQEAKGNEIYLMPLTRMVLFEKYFQYCRKRTVDVKFIYSGSTTIQYYFRSFRNRPV